MNEGRFTQFWACASTLFHPVNDEVLDRINTIHASEIEHWIADFRADLAAAKYGYSKSLVRATPSLEDQLTEIVGKYVLPLPRKAPTLCLTHDIDYIEPTWQLLVKRSLGYRKPQFMMRSNGFLPSIQAVLTTDRKFAGQAKSTVFLAAPWPANGIRERMIQYLIDPSYSLNSSLFLSLKETLREFDCEIGLHGSFHSLVQNTLKLEKEKLEQALGIKIGAARQHWLHLPGNDPFGEIFRSGLKTDSTLGWNGRPGFRGGFCRPFPIITADRNIVWELPLVLMDGPLFDEMKLSSDGVFAAAAEILDEVFKRGGCVAIDWHDRAADPDYGWLDAYEKILSWARERGFQFKTMSEAIAASTEKETTIPGSIA